MASFTKYKQDMPPEGGYKPLSFSRVRAREFFKGRTFILTFLGVHWGAIYIYSLNKKMVDRNELENKGGRIAMMPLLYAERDRAVLKHCHKNRQEEAELMKNVPGWEVGTWYGEPIYKTYPKDKFVYPWFYEYFAHADPEDYKLREQGHLAY